jgi:MFS family permease
LLANYSTFWLFTGDALTTVVYGFIALFWLPHGLRGQTKNAPWSEAFAYLKRDRSFHALWAAAFCAAIVFAQFGSTYSLHIIHENLTLDVFGTHLAPETIYGLLIAWNGVLVMVAELPLTALTLRYDARRVMALGYVLIGVGFGLNAWAFHIPSLLVAMTIFSVGEMISAPTTSALVARHAPVRLRGRYMGMLGLAWNGAAVAGPQFGFRCFALDPRLVWFGCALLGLVAAVITLLSIQPTRSSGVVKTTRTPEPETVGV